MQTQHLILFSNSVQWAREKEAVLTLQVGERALLSDSPTGSKCTASECAREKQPNMQESKSEGSDSDVSA